MRLLLRALRPAAFVMVAAAFGAAVLYAVDIFGGDSPAERVLSLHLTGADGRVLDRSALDAGAALVVGADDPTAIVEIAGAIAELGPLARSVRAVVLSDHPIDVPRGVEVLIGTPAEVTAGLASIGWTPGRVLLVAPGGEVAGDFPAGAGASELAARAARKAVKR